MKENELTEEENCKTTIRERERKRGKTQWTRTVWEWGRKVWEKRKRKKNEIDVLAVGNGRQFTYIYRAQNSHELCLLYTLPFSPFFHSCSPFSKRPLVKHQSKITAKEEEENQVGEEEKGIKWERKKNKNNKNRREKKEK